LELKTEKPLSASLRGIGEFCAIIESLSPFRYLFLVDFFFLSTISIRKIFLFFLINKAFLKE